MSTRPPSHNAPSSRFHVEVDDATGVFTAYGELDVATAPVLGDAAAGWRARRDPALSDTDLTVDLASLTFICAAGLNTLIGLRQDQFRRGRRLLVRNPSRSVGRVFRLGGVDELLTT